MGSDYQVLPIITAVAAGYNSGGQKHSDRTMTMAKRLYIFCQGYRRKRNGMMRKRAGKGTVPPVHIGILSGFQVENNRPPSLEDGFLRDEKEMKQKIKKLRADKRIVLCYTIKAISYRF